ncbi:MAG: hypothetical protein ACE5Q6_02290 [Dehalococcoidia bacterium]
MERVYETMEEIQTELRKRNIQATRAEVESALDQLDLRGALGPTDLKEIADHLGPQQKVSDRVLRVQRILDSEEWSEAVVARRIEVGLPANGLSEGQARDLHDALLDSLAGQPAAVSIKGKDYQPVVDVWRGIVVCTRILCTRLGIDPHPLDGLRDTYANGIASWLIGVRKLLNPEGVLKVGGRSIPYEPNQTDRLIGHLAWNLLLDGKTMEPKPAVTYKWSRLADGSGQFASYIINEKDANAGELKELKTKLIEIKRAFEDMALLSISNGEQWQGITWEQRWRKWNLVFPDFAKLTPGALRKAWEYAVNNREKIRARISKLTEVPSSS